MINTPYEKKKKYFSTNKTATTIFVTILVIAILVFIFKSTNHKKNDSLQISKYKSFSNTPQINSNKKTLESIKHFSAENRGQKNISIAFSQILATPPVNDIKVDQYKRVWIATEKGVYKLENDELTAFTQENGKYPFSQATCIESDGKYIWAGSLFGICRFNESGKFVNETNSFPLPSNVIWDVLWDGEQLWISTQKGVAFFKSSRIDNLINGITSDNTTEDNSTEDNAAHILDKTTTNNGLRSSWCTKIARYSIPAHSNWLAVTHDNGLSVLNLAFPAADPRFWKNIDHAKSYISRPIHDMIYDGSNIWLGTPTGLMMINTKLRDFPGNFSTEMISFSELHGLPSNNINSMVYHKNTIWLGTSNGLARLRNNQIQIISDISGKKPENIRKLALQGDGDNITLLWIGTDSGIQFINLQTAD